MGAFDEGCAVETMRSKLRGRIAHGILDVAVNDPAGRIGTHGEKPEPRDATAIVARQCHVNAMNLLARVSHLFHCLRARHGFAYCDRSQYDSYGCQSWAFSPLTVGRGGPRGNPPRVGPRT